jgi:2-hydroxychromene-2-carboxylate isomerase
LNLTFYFDFGSPNAYLAHKVLPALAERTGLSVTYAPILLGGVFKLTGNRSPMEAFAGIKSKLAYEQLETRRFVARHGLIAYRQNPHFPVNTLTLMRMAVAAQDLGVFEAYVDSVFADMWERGLKMDDPDVVRVALGEAGLPAADLLAGAGQDAVKARLIEGTAQAVDLGVFGAPSFLLGEALYFGKDRLDEIERVARAGVAP